MQKNMKRKERKREKKKKRKENENTHKHRGTALHSRKYGARTLMQTHTSKT